MRPEDVERGRLHAKSERYRKREREAFEIVEQALANYAPLYVAFSCGKDSTVMLDLVREVAPDVEARICLQPESFIVDDFADVLAWWRQRGARITEVCLHRDNLSDGSLTGGAAQWAEVHAAGPTNGAFVGMRMEESRRRRLSLGKYGPIHRYASGPLAGTVRIAPLLHWSLDDVTARIAVHGLKVLSSYNDDIDVRTTTGIPRLRVREEFLRDLQNRRPEAIPALRLLYPDIDLWI